MLGPVSFGKEVDALRQERENLESAKSAQLIAGRDAFVEEVQVLWRQTLDYWNTHKRPMTARDRHYVLTGKLLDGGSDELVPPPFPFVHVFKRNQQSVSSSKPPTEIAHGLDIRGWFALCEPGEIRELLPTGQSRRLSQGPLPSFDVASMVRDAANKVEVGYATRLEQLDESPDHLKTASEHLFGYTLFFSTSAGDAHIALTCSDEGPTRVLQADDDGWTEIATLRELVVGAVAELFGTPTS